MTIKADDYVLGVNTPTGRVALGPLVPMASGKYCVKAVTADGQIIAAGLNKLDTSGQFGIQAVTADGQMVGLTPAEFNLCTESMCPAKAPTIVFAEFSGTDDRGRDWSTLNGEWLGFPDMVKNDGTGQVCLTFIWPQADPPNYVTLYWDCPTLVWMVEVSTKIYFEMGIPPISEQYTVQWTMTDGGTADAVGVYVLYRKFRNTTAISSIPGVTLGTVEVTAFS